MAHEFFSAEVAWVLKRLAAYRDRIEDPPYENSYYPILHAFWTTVFHKAHGFLVKPQCRFGHHAASNQTGKPNSTGDMEKPNDRHAKYSDSAVAWVSGNGEQFRALISEAKNREHATNKRLWRDGLRQLKGYLSTANDPRAGQQNEDHRRLKSGDVHGVLTCGVRAFRVQVKRTKDKPIFHVLDDFDSGGLDLADTQSPIYAWFKDIRARFIAANRTLGRRWPEMIDVVLRLKDSYVDESSNTALVVACLEDKFPLAEMFLIKPQAALRERPSPPTDQTRRGRGTSTRSSSKRRSSKSREKSAHHTVKDSSGVHAILSIKFRIDLTVVTVNDPAVLEDPIELVTEVKRNDEERSLKTIVDKQLENSMDFIKTRLFEADYLPKRLASNKYVRGLAVMGNYIYIKNWTKNEETGRIVPQAINWQEHGFRMDQMPEAVKIKLLTHVDPKNLPGSYI